MNSEGGSSPPWLLPSEAEGSHLHCCTSPAPTASGHFTPVEFTKLPPTTGPNSTSAFFYLKSSDSFKINVDVFLSKIDQKTGLSYLKSETRRARGARGWSGLDLTSWHDLSRSRKCSFWSQVSQRRPREPGSARLLGGRKGSTSGPSTSVAWSHVWLMKHSKGGEFNGGTKVKCL